MERERNGEGEERGEGGGVWEGRGGGGGERTGTGGEGRGGTGQTDKERGAAARPGEEDDPGPGKVAGQDKLGKRQPPQPPEPLLVLSPTSYLPLAGGQAVQHRGREELEPHWPARSAGLGLK